MVKRRRSFTVGEKLQMIRTIEERRQQGESVRNICDEIGIDPRQYRDWRRARNKLISTKKKKRSFHGGYVSCIKHMEEELVNWIIEWRDQGAELSYEDVVAKASELDDDFGNKTRISKYHIVRRFCIANCLPIRSTTHVAQRNISETQIEALNFIREMRPILSAPDVHPSYILNMDQTPLNASPNKKRTLNIKGNKTVYSRRAGHSNPRFTAAVTITADGKKLKPMFIFKGVPTGDIATREFPRSPYRAQALLSCQPAAWMGTNEMLRWIDEILAPYIEDRPQGVTPILLLDNYKVHQVQEVQDKLAEIGVRPYWLPGGVTGLAQPVDVGITKPLKDRYRHQFGEWKKEMGIDRAILRTPSREIQQGWALASWQNIPQDVVRNAWRRSGFSYFPEQQEQAAA